MEDNLDLVFVVWAFFFQALLIAHFSLRKWLFEAYTERYGWIVYALSVPAALISVVLLRGGKPWSFWVGGILYLVWAGFGFTVEYLRGIRWRSPIHWPVFGPYVVLYLATVMFYWWPLGLIGRSLWFAYALLFVLSTILNVSSHRRPPDLSPLEAD